MIDKYNDPKKNTIVIHAFKELNAYIAWNI